MLASPPPGPVMLAPVPTRRAKSSWASSPSTRFTYGAAKAAQVNYTMSAALELGRFGVTANMVYPPVTDTGWVTDAVRDHVSGRPELIHIATPNRSPR